MAYTIEEINWKKMPEGATHFHLETRCDLFLWCRKTLMGRVEIYVHGFGWDKPKIDISKRSLMRVADHHPDVKVTIREKELKDFTRKAFIGFLDKHKLIESSYRAETLKAIEDYCNALTTEL